MSNEVILFDLPSKDGPKSWSSNAWKSRMLLNYKGIPYTTKWVEYPNIAPTLKDLGVTPNTSRFPYTIPAARIGGAYMQDSENIAKAVEELQPSPGVRLDDTEYLPQVHEALGGAFDGAFGALFPRIVPKVPRRILNPASVPYFVETREQFFGNLDELDRKVEASDEPWQAARPHIERLAALLKKEPEGPFFRGKTLTYADIVLVTALKFFERVDQTTFDKFVAVDEVLTKLYEASKPYLERDDH